MPILLALASAITYGISDYVGGRASRRLAPVAVAFVAEVALLVIFVIVVPLVESGRPTTSAVGWGIAAGASGGLGVLALYAALSRGNMTVAAPITGIVSAALPVVVGVAIGERPGAAAAIGIALAVVAVALIGGVVGVTRQAIDGQTMLLALAAGSGFGLLFVAYSQAGDDSGLWPLLMARAGGLPVLGAMFLVARRRGEVGPVSIDVLYVGLTIGGLIAIANGLYLVSTREGLLSVVAVVVSLYPASTIALASVLDHERAARSQVVGMLIAAVAVASIALGS